MKISKLLPTIQMQLAITDDDTSAQCVQCFLANMLDIGSILQLPSQRFQQEKLTIRECKDELMLATGQFTLLFDGEGQHTNLTTSNADGDKDKTDLLRFNWRG